MNNRLWTRRELLRGALAAAAGSTASRATLGMLGGLGLSSTAQAQSDYKALVCVFLPGGNDGFNLLVPSDSSRYSVYAKSRGGMALAQSQLAAINASANTEGSYGLHPSAAKLVSLFNNRKLTFLSNVGALLAPTTKSDYQAGKNLPRALFSHNDQQDFWQVSDHNAAKLVGWAGQMGDLYGNLNGIDLPLNITITGSKILQTGNFTVPYALSKTGVNKLSIVNDPYKLDRTAIYRKFLDYNQAASQLQLRTQADMTERAIDNATLVYDTLLGANSTSVSFPDTDLAQQLRMVTQLISVRDSLKMQRQIFFVELSGFDTHDDQLNRQATLITTLSDALVAFQASLEQLGVADKVATFTMSEFGRTLTSNGDGTDHAWGSNLMLMSNALRARKVYGSFPDLSIGGKDDAGYGRIIPTTAVQQFGAELARWFGASSDELASLFPYLSRFPAMEQMLK